MGLSVDPAKRHGTAPTHCFSICEAGRGARSFGGSTRADGRAHLDEILRVVRVELRGHGVRQRVQQSESGGRADEREAEEGEMRWHGGGGGMGGKDATL